MFQYCQHITKKAGCHGTNKIHYKSIFTLDYMTTAEENKYFDRKSAKIKVYDLADLISAFANAEGGT